LASITDTMPSGILAYAYQRDANGNVTAENSARYGYDALNRLASWYDPATDTTTTYAYDGAYNVTGVSIDGSQTQSFAYDAAGRISTSGYAFDANGNMTSDGEHDYIYDPLNRLSAVKDVLSGETIASYTYDSVNRRISATDASGTTYFHYDGGSPDVIAETDGAGHTLAAYAYGAAGQLVSMRRGGESYYYHLNGHGDVTALTDAAGTIVDSYTYDPWGRVLSASEAVPNPYRYAGYRYDVSTGLYYLWNRYYSPECFRFITHDLYPGKTSQPGTMNGYAYCLDDPVGGVDPSGLAFDPLACATGLAMGTLAGMVIGAIAPSVAPALLVGGALIGSFAAGYAIGTAIAQFIIGLPTGQSDQQASFGLGLGMAGASGIVGAAVSPSVAPSLSDEGCIVEGAEGNRILQFRSLSSGEPFFRVERGWVRYDGERAWLIHFHAWPDMTQHLPWDWFN
jgi:RHS repeat-associated protein